MSSVVRAADAERGVDHGTGATEISWVERKGVGRIGVRVARSASGMTKAAPAGGPFWRAAVDTSC